MSVRLLALDLDGTLLDSRGEVSERNRRAIEEARGMGVRVAFVTGRRFRDARPLALSLGLDAPVISHNGALTKHARTLETVSVTLLPLSEAREVLRVGRERNLDAMISDDPHGAGVLVYDHINDDNHAFRRYIEWSRRIHGDEAEESVRRVESLEDYLNHEPLHISYSGTCAAMESLGEALKCELGESVKVFATIYPRMDFGLIDVLNRDASKGAGVAAAAAEAGIEREEVMAVGDNFNDLEMLDYAGTGVLMGNADARLLGEKTGLHVTATNDEDGVAVAIEKFIINV
ncbi:MAG TPA: Cof-type HAD-IIB family hydrolase [Pyrinomonadaceae bacterium]|nr:Cof-type HAD-IIB family hydrolase [Pyrinomonadaceae bacterium]